MAEVQARNLGVKWLYLPNAASVRQFATQALLRTPLPLPEMYYQTKLNRTV